MLLLVERWLSKVSATIWPATTSKKAAWFSGFSRDLRFREHSGNVAKRQRVANERRHFHGELVSQWYVTRLQRACLEHVENVLHEVFTGLERRATLRSQTTAVRSRRRR